MKLIETSLSDCYLVEYDRQEDRRGSFTRSFDLSVFADLGLPNSINYTAEAINHAAFTLRGLHYQKASHPEPKLVRCLRGIIYDVVVDIRSNSATFGQWQSVRLEADDGRAVLIPAGFAHGYLTLASSSTVSYHMFAPYVVDAQRGLRWDDPLLRIEWPAKPRIMSERDMDLPTIDRTDPRNFNFSEPPEITASLNLQFEFPKRASS